MSGKFGGHIETHVLLLYTITVAGSCLRSGDLIGEIRLLGEGRDQ